MSHSIILIPSDSTGESVRLSPSMVILPDTKAEVMVILEITPEAVAIVASPTIALDHAIDSNLEVEPFEATPSPDYVPFSLIHAPALPDYHLGPDTKSEPFEDESKPIEDALEVAEPLSTQVAPPPPVQITPTSPTSPTDPTPTPPIIPHDT
ncbi:hypothetical protein Tco_1369050 [Tanacetum coccineum]